MQFKVIEFSRKKQSAKDLEDALSNLLKSNTVVSIDSVENAYASTVLVSLTTIKKTLLNQVVKVFGIDDLTTMISDIDTYAQSLKEESIEAINLVPIGGNRAVGIVLTSNPVKVDDKPKRTRTKKY